MKAVGLCDRRLFACLVNRIASVPPAIQKFRAWLLAGGDARDPLSQPLGVLGALSDLAVET